MEVKSPGPAVHTWDPGGVGGSVISESGMSESVSKAGKHDGSLSWSGTPVLFLPFCSSSQIQWPWIS